MAATTILKTSLELLYYSGASQALRPVFGGLGAIFMLHHVRPGGGQQMGFAPNAGLEVTPEFLDAVISFVKLRGYDLVSMTEAVRRIRERSPWWFSPSMMPTAIISSMPARFSDNTIALSRYLPAPPFRMEPANSGGVAWKR